MDSKRFYWLFLLLLTLTRLSQVLCSRVGYPDTNEEDAHILLNCLEVSHNSESILKKLEKVTRYSQWSEEEVPCFTRCLAIGKAWFDRHKDQWNLQKLVDDLGADVYNYCRFELDTREERMGACLFAYRGLKCLKQAEHYTVETYSTLLDCANSFKANLSILQDYAKFPKTETVPCLFKCFADQMNLYNSQNEPELENWFKAFGPPKRSRRPVILGECKKNFEDKSEICHSMYRQYMCIENMLYDTNGDGQMHVLRKVAVEVTTANIREKANMEFPETITAASKLSGPNKSTTIITTTANTPKTTAPPLTTTTVPTTTTIEIVFDESESSTNEVVAELKV